MGDLQMISYSDGSFRPAVSVDQAVAMLLAHSDGCEFASAVPLPSVSGRQLNDNAFALARLLLGADSAGRT